MSPKLYIAISAMLQIVLVAGMFHSHEQPTRVVRQTDNTGMAQTGDSPQTTAINRCSNNSDSLYNRQKVLKQLARILNSTATFFYNAKYLNKLEIHEASVKNERPIGFTVYDLIEPSNFGAPLESQCIEFKNTHVYHFTLISTPYSFSHIVILEGGQLKVFKAINCKEGDRLEDLINYLNQKLKDRRDKDAVIDRVSNYRKFGNYFAIDDFALRCEDLNKKKK